MGSPGTGSDKQVVQEILQEQGSTSKAGVPVTESVAIEKDKVSCCSPTKDESAIAYSSSNVPPDGAESEALPVPGTKDENGQKMPYQEKLL